MGRHSTMLPWLFKHMIRFHYFTLFLKYRIVYIPCRPLACTLYSLGGGKKCTFLLLFVLLIPLFILGRGCWGELLLSQWCPGCCISKILEPNCMGEAGSSWAELNSVGVEGKIRRFEAVKSNPFLSSTAAEIPSKLA